MSTSFFQLLANLLLITANSLATPAPLAQSASYAPAGENQTAELVMAEQRRHARAARIGLADPYYSFSRVKRAHKD